MTNSWNAGKFLRHPIAVLVLGAVLSGFLVPWISSRLTEQKLRQEARYNTAAEIIQSASAVDIAFNKIYNTVESFHADNVAMLKGTVSGKQRRDFIRERQQELRRNMREAYDEFDGKAWWWYREAEKKAGFLGLTSESEMQRLRDAALAYDRNLVQAAEIYKDLANHFLQPDYDASDSHYGALIGPDRQRVVELYVARQQLVVTMAEIFACPSSHPCAVRPSIGPTPVK
ncbi:MAG TPA: hypothetical protein VFO39_15525 [Candidatus Sulfotelmatobacter sp.]|nr:hypothetical protein [Candidatus Sulfotelmatobacter sp.]